MECEYPNVYNERYPRAAKEYKCSECGKAIEKGEQYAYIFAVFPSFKDIYRQHLRCFHLCRALNGNAGECVIPFEGMMPVGPYEARALDRESAMFRVSVSMGLVDDDPDRDDPEWQPVPKPTQEDWAEVCRLSIEYGGNHRIPPLCSEALEARP